MHDPAALAGGYDSHGSIGNQNVCAFPRRKQRAGKRNVILAIHYLPVIELTVFKLRRQGQGE